MIAGVNANACDQLPLLGCTAALDGISQLDGIPSNMKAGLTVADICPCGTCAGNLTPNSCFCRNKIILQRQHKISINVITP